MLAKTIVWRPALCVGIAFFSLFMFEPQSMQSGLQTATLNKAPAAQQLQALRQENRELRSKLASLPSRVTPAFTAAAANDTYASQAVAHRNAGVVLPTTQVNDS